MNGVTVIPRSRLETLERVKAMLAARHHGGAEYRNLAAIDHILSRFARRHAPDPERAA